MMSPSKLAFTSSSEVKSREMMSLPIVFIFEWNSRQATPSPRSRSDAPVFSRITGCRFRNEVIATGSPWSAFVSSKGPISQAKPHRIARSMASGSSEISGTRDAAYSDIDVKRSETNAAARSGLFNRVFTRSGRLSMLDTISSEGMLGLCCGRYSIVSISSVRISSPCFL